jgi:PAS domain S-box-containing protein
MNPMEVSPASHEENQLQALPGPLPPETPITDRELLRALLDHAPDAIFFKDRRSRFLRISQAHARKFRLTDPSEAVGKTDFDYFTAAFAGAAYADEQEILRTGHPIIDRVIMEAWEDGSVTWVTASKLPLYDSAGNVIGTFGICRDITERKRFEAQLLQAQKMETVGKLAGGIAHEFNSIMTAIIGQSELLLADLSLSSPLIKNAAEIRKAAERAATLTRQLLAFGRKQILRLEILDLNAVLAGLEGMLLHLMGPDVEVRIVPGAGPKSVKADSGQIEQVIVNIAMNAVDAMPHGGVLSLETSAVALDEPYVSQFSELKAGEYVMLAITDTGSGMSEEVKAHIFEPFFTTKGVGRGTGLGLATCYGILKQIGGHIAVHSEPGRGATFKVYLPKVEREATIPDQPKTPADLPRGTETIFLVENDAALRSMAATLLQRLGYGVLTAADGIEAMGLAHRRELGRIDLLFTDRVMPHVGGLELTERFHALFPQAGILFASAYSEGASAHPGALNPGVELLSKPFTPSMLAHKVREMLDKAKGR